MLLYFLNNHNNSQNLLVWIGYSRKRNKNIFVYILSPLSKGVYSLGKVLAPEAKFISLRVDPQKQEVASVIFLWKSGRWSISLQIFNINMCLQMFQTKLITCSILWQKKTTGKSHKHLFWGLFLNLWEFAWISSQTKHTRRVKFEWYMHNVFPTYLDKSISKSA